MVLIAAILYGIVPGIVKVGGWFELLFVNTLSMPFNTGLITTLTTQLDAIVMWSWNALELWCVSQEVTEETGTDNITTNNNPTIRKAIIDNQLVIYIDNDLYSILGTKL